MERKHGHWTIRGTECRYRDDFVEFWVDDVVGPDGRRKHRATLRMLPGVAVLPLDDEGYVYLTRQFRYAVGKECVEAVGGAIDEGEGEAEAARRELREELGIEAEEMTDLGLVDSVTSQVFSPSRIFLARGLSFGEPEREVTEEMQTVKVKLDEAVRMVSESEITQGNSCVLILKADRLIRSEGKGGRRPSRA